MAVAFGCGPANRSLHPTPTPIWLGLLESAVDCSGFEFQGQQQRKGGRVIDSCQGLASFASFHINSIIILYMVCRMITVFFSSPLKCLGIKVDPSAL